MEYEDINENTIKITLSFDDLTDHDIKLSDFFGNQDLIEQFFYELVDELGLENRFSNVGMLTFQIQPFSQGVHMIVHEESFLNGNGEMPDPETPEEFQEMMENFYDKLNNFGEQLAKQRGMNPNDFKPENMPFGFGPDMTIPPQPKEGEEEEKEPDFIYYSVCFEDMASVLTAAKNVRFEDEESEFYRYDGAFYLVVLNNQKKKGKTKVDTNRSRMFEYGDPTPNGREYLREYGECLIESNALDILRKISA